MYETGDTDRWVEIAVLWRGELLEVHHGRPNAERMVRVNGVPMEVPELREGERTTVKRGPLTYAFRSISAEPMPLARREIDYGFARTLTLCAIAHVYFAIAAELSSSERGRLEDEVLASRRVAFIRTMLERHEDPRPKRANEKGGHPAPKKEGRIGLVDAPRRDAARGKRGARAVDPDKRMRDREIARKAGILAFIGSSGATTTIFGPGGLDGLNARMGGIGRAPMGDASGANGLGSRGNGPGGGGPSIGIGTLFTHSGRGTGGDGGDLDLTSRGHAGPRPKPTMRIKVGDGLPREVIARVIKANIPRFRFCYEKELNADPDLAGKITVSFTIAPTGAVAAASIAEATMNSERVESCVVGVMRSLAFPRPSGGGIVVVTYPFVFAAASAR
jgi:hypothetical protein